MIQLLKANLHYLEQAAELVVGLDDETYRRPEPAFYDSSVGGHLRHCLDHYESFISGVSEGSIDYDCRARDERLEVCTTTALERIRHLSHSLKEMSSSNNPNTVQVKMDCGGCSEDEISWQESTVGRELQFLLSHTVHHYAMIRGLCASAKINLSDQFGMAPSTLRHRDQCAAS